MSNKVIRKAVPTVDWSGFTAKDFIRDSCRQCFGTGNCVALAPIESNYRPIRCQACDGTGRKTP